MEEQQVTGAADAAPVEKYPELRAMFDKLRAERDGITVVLDPLRAKRDALVAAIAPQEEEIRQVGARIKEIQSGRLYELDNQIAALARAMGARGVRASDDTEGSGHVA